MPTKNSHQFEGEITYCAGLCASLGSRGTRGPRFLHRTGRHLRKGERVLQVVMGDLNAKGGSRNVEKFGLGKRNRRGIKLVEFALEANLKIANTYFKKKKKREWAWFSPDTRTKDKIDHGSINDLAVITDVSTLAKFDFPSDHKMTRITLVIPKRARFNNYRKKEARGKMIIRVSKMDELREGNTEKLKGLKISRGDYDRLEEINKNTTCEFCRTNSR